MSGTHLCVMLLTDGSHCVQVLQDKDGVRKSTQVDAVEGQLQYEVVLDQLLAGQSYTITVTAIREIDTDVEESLPQVQNGTTSRFSVGL